MTEPTQSQGDIETIVVPRTSDLGDGFEVRRALPSRQRRMVGPFVFLDQMGPHVFNAGSGLDVRPHPHIGLATVTYLFEGEIHHRDSLGTSVAIRPGEVNWMTAGRGIVHSERTAPEQRQRRAASSRDCSAGWRCRANTRKPNRTFCMSAQRAARIRRRWCACLRHRRQFSRGFFAGARAFSPCSTSTCKSAECGDRGSRRVPGAGGLRGVGLGQGGAGRPVRRRSVAGL
jgi:hypothetical protein